jgi:hypothetical protein
VGVNTARLRAYATGLVHGIADCFWVWTADLRVALGFGSGIQSFWNEEVGRDSSRFIRSLRAGDRRVLLPKT